MASERGAAVEIKYFVNARNNQLESAGCMKPVYTCFDVQKRENVRAREGNI